MTRLLAGLAAALVLAGCGASGAAAQPDGLRVVATMSVFAEFAQEVGGEFVDVTSIVPVGGDPHTYEPAPSDAARIADADVVLDNGLGLSPWFQPLAEGVTGELVVLTEDISARAVESGGKVDPHLWMVPTFVAEGYTTAIEDAFAAADPDHAQDYADNAAAFRAELAELDADLGARIATIPEESRRLITSHDAYSYFADHYGLDVVGTVLGVSTEEEPSARHVAELVQLIRDTDVPAIFVETTVNPGLVEQVARDTGIAIGDPLYGDSVGEPGSGADTYVGMMEANVDAIVTGLGGEAG